MNTDETPEAAAALDLLLTQAALGPLRRFFPGRPALRFARALAGQPGLVTSRVAGLAAEFARFDILFWNADTTRMTAGLHRDFVRSAVSNSLASPGGLTVRGTEIDLAQVDLDSYVVAGVADHICPWQSCYRGSQLLGGRTRFVLSSSGHIAALVNQAGSKKSSYQASDDVSADAAAWQQSAVTERGSWWPDYASWLAARSGAQVPAPAAVGGDRFRVIEPAPGSYVRAA